MVKLFERVEDRPTPKAVYNWRVYSCAIVAATAAIMIGSVSLPPPPRRPSRPLAGTAYQLLHPLATHTDMLPPATATTRPSSARRSRCRRSRRSLASSPRRPRSSPPSAPTSSRRTRAAAFSAPSSATRSASSSAARWASSSRRSSSASEPASCSPPTVRAASGPSSAAVSLQVSECASAPPALRRVERVSQH